MVATRIALLLVSSLRLRLRRLMERLVASLARRLARTRPNLDPVRGTLDIAHRPIAQKPYYIQKGRNHIVQRR